jgi:cytochrome c551
MNVRSKSNVFWFLVLLHAGCATKSETQSPAPSEHEEFARYMMEGGELYNLHCANCHQHSGKGLGKVFPPLDNADYMEANLSQVICLIKNGLRGEIVVNGISFSEPMPGAPQLTHLELAQVTTYIYNAWSNKKGMITLGKVEVVLQSSCE